jgi:formylglycine-generating enzyme required for sulfatase activity
MPCSHLPPPDAPDPLRVDDRHLSETVVLLARGIATDLAFDRLPILADALEDGGCDNFALLSHLRGDHFHRVDCWALRRLLRTTLMLPGDVPMTFAYCPAGSFIMGSDDAESSLAEQPRHLVTLTQGFYASVYPVTELQWRTVTGVVPEVRHGDQHPVVQVNWDDAQRFCQMAREFVERALRLPTEAEWEYGCRAGTTTKYHFGDTFQWQLAQLGPHMSEYGADIGWTEEVGSFPANPWGLFDCHGNVAEWCSDWYANDYYSVSPSHDPVGPPNGTLRVARGWDLCRDEEPDCRAALRRAERPGTCVDDLGFRVVFTA